MKTLTLKPNYSNINLRINAYNLIVILFTLFLLDLPISGYGQNNKLRHLSEFDSTLAQNLFFSKVYNTKSNFNKILDEYRLSSITVDSNNNRFYSPFPKSIFQILKVIPFDNSYLVYTKLELTSNYLLFNIDFKAYRIFLLKYGNHGSLINNHELENFGNYHKEYLDHLSEEEVKKLYFKLTLPNRYYVLESKNDSFSISNIDWLEDYRRDQKDLEWVKRNINNLDHKTPKNIDLLSLTPLCDAVEQTIIWVKTEKNGLFNYSYSCYIPKNNRLEPCQLNENISGSMGIPFAIE